MSTKTKRIIAVICVVALLVALFAGCMAPQTTAAEGEEGTENKSPLGNYTYIIMFVLLITTIGGLTGKICSIKDDLITFETGEDRVRIQVTKWAVSTKGTDTNQTAK